MTVCSVLCDKTNELRATTKLYKRTKKWSNSSISNIICDRVEFNIGLGIKSRAFSVVEMNEK